MIHASQQVFVMADSSKIGKASLIDIAPLEVVRAVITDEGIPPSLMDEISRRGVEVHIARNDY